MKFSMVVPSISVLVFGLVTTGSAEQTSLSTYPTECTPGVWALKSKDIQRDGSYVDNAASSTRYCLFNGTVFMDEFRYLAPDGSVVFRGVSFSTQNPDHSKEKILWAMVGDKGTTLIEGQIIDGVLNTSGHGRDNSGEFLEKATTTYAGPEDSTFIMDRSYDGGNYWIAPFNVIEGKRVSTSPPPLPQKLDNSVSKMNPYARGTGQWHLATREAKDDGTVALGHATENINVILDGYAEVSEITEYNTDGTERVRFIRFSTRDVETDTWRSVIWPVGSDKVIVDELLITGGTGQRVHARSNKHIADLEVKELTEKAFTLDASRDGTVLGTVLGHRIAPEDTSLHPMAEMLSGSACGTYDFTLGNWALNASTINPDQTQNPGVGYVYGYRLHDNNALAAEMHVIFEDGTGFRGTTFRSLNPQTGAWHITWITDNGPAGQSGFSDSVDTNVCEEKWTNLEDQYGKYETLLRLFDIAPDSFKVIMDNKYLGEGAPTIRGVWSYSASRIKP